MEKEKIIRNMPEPVSISGTETILNQMKNCLCKIKINQTYGTGFFCKIPYENEIMNVLMTNYHVLDENYYNENNIFNLFINDDKDVKILNLKNERKAYFNEEYDLAMIELKEEDDINNYLELDDNLFKNEVNAFYEDLSIYTIQYPLGKNAAVSYGLSNGMNDFEIMHTCSTEHGSSGSPILNLSNNKVIGIHKQSSNNFNYNIGTCLQFPLNDFFEKNEIDNNNNINEDNEENNKINNDILNNYTKIIKEFNEILNDTINDLKYQIGAEQKINITFFSKFNNKLDLNLNYGTSIDQMLKIFLRRIGRKDLIDRSEGICFIFNGNRVNFRDETPIELFFNNFHNPKLFVIYDAYKFPEEEYQIRISFLAQILNVIDFLKIQSDKLTIKFNNGGNIIEIEIHNDYMVAELINEYFEKTKTYEGKFIFNNKILSPYDVNSLYEVGLKDNSEINVEI